MDSDFRPAKQARSLRSKLDKRTAETPTSTPETDFRPPEEVAAADDLIEHASEPLKTSEPTSKAADKKSWRARLQALHINWPFGQREWLVSAIIVIVGGFIVSYVLMHVGAKPVASADVTPIVRKIPKKPVTVPSTLTGLQVDPHVNSRPVTGIMIENSLDARPQSGLSEAGVVFEAIAEGGITRFLALYQDTNPGDVGPVRSARPYYIQWAMGFDAGYAHVGGSPEALQDIKAWGVRDLDQFYNAGAYRRISGRPAPHNVYTGIDNLIQLENSKGYTSSSYTGFTRKKAAPAKQPAAKSINLTLSGPLYNVHYDYDAASNSYRRSEGGSAHMDAAGNKQISPSVVIALVTPYGIQADGKHSEYGVIGSGTAYIFQDGLVTTATWSKPDAKSQIRFSDGAGKAVDLNPGQTWLTAVSAPSNVSSTP